MTFWEVDILGIDISGVDILGVDILGVDILRRTHFGEYKATTINIKFEYHILPAVNWGEPTLTC